MKFICGVVDKQGARHILSAESTPSLEHIDDLAQLAPAASYDWGPEAGENERRWTARIILSSVTNTDEALLLAPKYADEVVSSFIRVGMWILPVEEVEAWVTQNRRVM